MKLPVAGRVLVKGAWWDLDRPVLDARLVRGKVVVIFDRASYPRGKAAPNLVAFNLKQELLWVADNPTGHKTDGYAGFLSESPLKVANFAGLNCRIDVETGKINKILFTE